MIQIRDFNPLDDYPLITRLTNSFYNEQRTVESVMEADSHLPFDTISIRKIAKYNGKNVGSLRITRLGNANFLWFSIIIDPEYRGRGIGTYLYNEGEKLVEELGAKFLYCQVFDHMTNSISFAQNKGFVVDRHIFDSKLTITKDTLGLDTSKLKEAEEKGFIFNTMEDIKNDNSARVKLHELYLRTSLDIPGWTEKPPTFDEFCNSVFNHSGYIPKGQFIIKKDNEWVGMSTLIYTKETNSLYTTMTGIDSKYRGNGLAYILKMLTIQYAIDSNISYMLTHNDSKNHAMLKINKNVGYQPQPGYYRMIRTI
jgi:RimJ/RimL family protein N-acetyltransferase